MQRFVKEYYSLIIFIFCVKSAHGQNSTTEVCEDTEKGACFLVKDRPYLCYQVNNTELCCSTCKQFFTYIEGCEYGDRRKACNKRRCSKDGKHDPLCCWTCGGFTTTTTTTTTTQPPATKKSTTQQLISMTTAAEHTTTPKTISIHTPVMFRKHGKASHVTKHRLNVAWSALKRTFFVDIDKKI
ncbi:uncharacterized protein LOC125648435 [Ostrea edulis]|uniref:uncharacterized protein LOC125648435 n=1 Tax=Ostrea edulis TaxID=37623 RepID=UPI0024AF61DB|nr:uncharacterized protein LOC125648435 [Ostrea edulis]